METGEEEVLHPATQVTEATHLPSDVVLDEMLDKTLESTSDGVADVALHEMLDKTLKWMSNVVADVALHEMLEEMLDVVADETVDKAGIFPPNRRCLVVEALSFDRLLETGRLLVNGGLHSSCLTSITFFIPYPIEL